MLTRVLAVGVDLSAEDTKTWMASLDFTQERATLVTLNARVSNQQIVEAAGTADKVGIDCPFGWPVAFQEFVNEHMNGSVSPQAGTPLEWRRHLAYRETDRFVTRMTGLRPLSVAADRIAHPAMRCAALLAELDRAGVAVDRSGANGAVVEVYPAASLLRWRLRFRGYKRLENEQTLDQLVMELRAKAPWLDLGEHSICRKNDDAFDAVVAALSAAAAASGLSVSPPDAVSADLAKREGWIAIPEEDSLPGLLNAVAAVSRA